ncbi:hypothetical protein H7X46_26805 [Pseudonocardia sp. C8]|uniref:hypothetical protein n=1 Tax=Pseudonocardia sp. C8 TaxID=2762759 RepID=UPI00164249F1|nr:hypothetical protein [Pseudonocardia sp. C8]MBC3194665.1 hypothetical protein [Pseudonocardia sp. C8]
MTRPHHPDVPYRDDAARRIGEALHAQARGRPMPPQRPPGPAPAPPRGPGRAGPPPEPRPRPPQHRPAATAAPAPGPAGSPTGQILWSALIVLLVGALLGGGIALVSVLLPGALPALG